MKETTISRRSLVKKIAITGGMAIGLPHLLSAAVHREAADSKGENFTFLFQGDSITDGNRTRNQDWNHVMGHGYAYLIASRLWYDQPDKRFHFFNRGVSGNKTTDLAARWQQDTIDLKPDLLSILVGVNDANSMFGGSDPVPPARFEEVYKDLLAQTRQQLPNATIVLCEPFLLPVGRVKDKWEDWSADMKERQQIVRQLADQFRTIFVPLQDDFNKACEKAPADYWIWDGIHPMPGGHELIARKWLRTVKKQLSFIK